MSSLPHLFSVDSIPAELRALPQWVGWRYETRKGKQTKPPISPKSNGSLLYAKTNDPTTWTDFDTALATASRLKLEGVGFCFAETDGLTGIDLDHVFNPETGELDPEAAEILKRFQDTYIEVSPSGTGFRLFCYGKPGRSGKIPGKEKWLEVYSHPSSRYLTTTGNRLDGNEAGVTDQQEALDWLHARFMAPASPVESEPPPAPAAPLDFGSLRIPQGREPAPAPTCPRDLSDQQLLEKAHNAANGATFARLWSGDGGDDDSAADFALCNILAFWTDGDHERIDRLFRRSGLMRPKWDEIHYSDGSTYGQVTTDRAVRDLKVGYSAKRPGAPEPDPAKVAGFLARLNGKKGEPGDQCDDGDKVDLSALPPKLREQAERVQQALAFVGQEKAFVVGCAVSTLLKKEFPDVGAAICKAWHAEALAAYAKADPDYKQKTGKPQATVNSIFKAARMNGWKDEKAGTEAKPTITKTTRATVEVRLDCNSRVRLDFDVPDLQAYTPKDGTPKCVDSIAAERIAMLFGSRIACNEVSHFWHLYDGVCWRSVTGAEFGKVVSAIMRAGLPDCGYTAPRRAGVLSELEAFDSLRLRITNDGSLIPFENGILDIATRTLHPITPNNAFTWTLPYQYDPAAQCPRVLAWLGDMLEHPESLEFMRAIFFVTLRRIPVQIFLHLIGPGGGGKGTLIRLMEKLIGADNSISTSFDAMTNRFEPERWFEKRLMIVNEADEKISKAATSIVKKITGGDTLRAEPKGERAFNFRFDGLLTISSNASLNFGDSSGALIRRRRTIHVDRSFSGAERAAFAESGGEEALHAEIPGLINWILGMQESDARRLIEQPPAAIEEDGLEEERDTNHILGWMTTNVEQGNSHEIPIGYFTEHTQTVKDGDCSISRRVIDNADTHAFPNFVMYLATCGIHADSFNHKTFSRAVISTARAMGFRVEKRKKNGSMWLRGIRLRTHGEQNEHVEHDQPPPSPPAPASERPAVSPFIERIKSNADATAVRDVLRLADGPLDESDLARRLGWPVSRVIATVDAMPDATRKGRAVILV